MASKELVQNLVDYYVNLLIIQYNIAPKAQATIRILAETMLASGIYFDVENAYNIIPIPSDFWDSNEDWDDGGTWDQSEVGIAVGNQLDIIGKYVGVSRFYPGIELDNYFSLIEYDEITMPPSSPPRFGFETYATFGEFNYNGTLVYDDIVTIQNALSDADFLTMIQLAIITNNMNFSYGNIDSALYTIFQDTIRAESIGNMQMFYFIAGPFTALIKAIIFQNLFPVPMGVGMGIVSGYSGLIFGMVGYDGIESPYAYGFSDYTDYATLSGDVLTYSQIS